MLVTWGGDGYISVSYWEQSQAPWLQKARDLTEPPESGFLVWSLPVLAKGPVPFPSLAQG